MIRKPQEWHELTKITQGRPITVERVRLGEAGAAIEGAWDLPQLARLSAEDQVFVTAFVRSHGSIKEMERLFGVSYPTIKSRLNRLSERLGPALDLQPPADTRDDAAPRRAILDRDCRPPETRR